VTVGRPAADANHVCRRDDSSISALSSDRDTQRVRKRERETPRDARLLHRTASPHEHHHHHHHTAAAAATAAASLSLSKAPMGITEVAFWLRGDALVSIDEVTLRRARLVLGWVAVCRRINHPCM